MSERDNDIPGLDELSELYRHGQRPEPPTPLDRKILSAARPRKTTQWRWAIPASLAACLVLGVGLVGQLRQRSPSPAPPSAPAEALLANPETARPAAPAQDRAAPLQAQTQAARRESQAADPDPESWLERIAELRRQGRLAEAEAEQREFRRQYPEYVYPPAAGAVDEQP